MTSRVLIATRRAATRERLRTALEAHGFAVCASCRNAPETIEAAVRTRAEICVVHLDLPGGGLTACRALASRRRQPRIVVLAPSDREGELPAAIRAGADGFILDDLDPSGVPAAVAELAAGRPVLSSSATARLIAELRRPGPSERLHDSLAASDSNPHLAVTDLSSRRAQVDVDNPGGHGGAA